MKKMYLLECGAGWLYSLLRRLIFVFFLFCSSCFYAVAQVDGKVFSFAFMTDIHIDASSTDSNLAGLELALNAVKKQGVDFIVTGGDNINADKLKDDRAAADRLAIAFHAVMNSTGLPVYFAMGNHDRYKGAGVDEEASVFTTHFGQSYYSFEHKGCRFVVLNSLQHEEGVYPCIDSTQLAWLAQLPASANEPLVAITHVPLLSTVVADGKELKTGDIARNGRQAVDILQSKNLKLVLQGHKHVYEEVLSHNIHFVNGGAVSGTWWSGPCRDGKPRGFLVVDVYADSVAWRYVEF